jgi:hypothetical protein
MNESSSLSRSPALAGGFLPPLAGPEAPRPRGLPISISLTQVEKGTHDPRGPPRPPRIPPLGAVGAGAPPEILASRLPLEGP